MQDKGDVQYTEKKCMNFIMIYQFYQKEKRLKKWEDFQLI